MSLSLTGFIQRDLHGELRCVALNKSRRLAQGCLKGTLPAMGFEPAASLSSKGASARGVVCVGGAGGIKAVVPRDRRRGLISAERKYQNILSLPFFFVVSVRMAKYGEIQLIGIISVFQLAPTIYRDQQQKYKFKLWYENPPFAVGVSSLAGGGAETPASCPVATNTTSERRARRGDPSCLRCSLPSVCVCMSSWQPNGAHLERIKEIK